MPMQTCNFLLSKRKNRAKKCVLFFFFLLNLMRQFQSYQQTIQNFTLMDSALSSSQDVVLMRALRDMNLPKFVFEDVPLFLGLISDLFPGLDCPRVRYPSFNDAVEQDLQEKKYIILPNQVSLLDLRSLSYKVSVDSVSAMINCWSILLFIWFQVDKVVQMYETMMTRHTTMVVGPTGGGKSVVISTLCQAQTKSVSFYFTFFITSLIPCQK